MNLLDLLLIGLLVASAVAGWRLGFLARVLSWGGLLLGVVVAVVVLDDVVAWLDDTAPETRVVAATGFVLVLGLLGQAIGLALGALFRHPRPGGPHAVDRAAGAVAGCVGLLVLVWLVTPAFAGAEGWPARQARGSAVVAAVDEVAPDPPNSLEALSRLVAETPFPEVFGDLRGPPDVGGVPGGAPTPEVDAAVRTSTVKVVGQACDQIQEGTGFVVDEDLVATNAHVVAGERGTEVLSQDGRRLFGTVVLFDPDRDLAALRVPDLGLPVLPLAEGQEGDVGAVYGYPGGGPLRAAPARIAEQIVALGTDIYRTGDTRREVYVLAASLVPGDSGGPLVDATGAVVGVAFAIDPADPDVAYALTDDELTRSLREIRSVGVDTGPCLAA